MRCLSRAKTSRCQVGVQPRTRWISVICAAGFIAVLGFGAAVLTAVPAKARVFVGFGFGVPIGFPYYYPPYPYPYNPPSPYCPLRPLILRLLPIRHQPPNPRVLMLRRGHQSPIPRGGAGPTRKANTAENTRRRRVQAVAPPSDMALPAGMGLASGVSSIKKCRPAKRSSGE